MTQRALEQGCSWDEVRPVGARFGRVPGLLGCCPPIICPRLCPLTTRLCACSALTDGGLARVAEDTPLRALAALLHPPHVLVQTHLEAARPLPTQTCTRAGAARGTSGDWGGDRHPAGCRGPRGRTRLGASVAHAVGADAGRGAGLRRPGADAAPPAMHWR